LFVYALGVRRDERAAAGDRADRVDQVLVGRALEHVTRRSCLQRLEQVALVVVHRQQQHVHVGRLVVDVARRLEAGHARHRDVEHGDVGLLGDDLLDGVDAVLGLGDHAHALLLVEQHAQAGAHDAVVVGDQDVEHRNLIGGYRA
jgi:hypothetical protein